MTQEETIEMAVSAGIVPWTKHEYIGGNNFSATEDGLDGDIASLLQFAKLVEDAAFKRWAAQTKLAVQDEREACAKRAEIALLGTLKTTSDRVLKAIRARGEA